MVAIQRSLDQSVQHSLRLVFLLIGGLVLLAFTAAVMFGQSMMSRMGTLYADRILPLQDMQLISHVVNVRIPDRYWRGDYAGLQESPSALAKDWAEVEQAWQRYMTTYLTDEEVVLARELRASIDGVRTILLVPGGDERADRAFGIQAMEYTEAVRRVNQGIDRLNALQVKVAGDLLKSAETVSHWATVIAVLVLATMLWLGLFAHRLIGQRVLAPIEWVARALERLARGEVQMLPTPRPLSADFNDVLDQVERLRQFVAERQRLLDEEQRISQRLRTAQAELVEAEKLASLGGLVAGVAHELNTPIGVAVTVASSLDGKRKAFLDSMIQGLRRSVLETFLADVEQACQLLGSNLDRAATLVRSFKQVAVDRTGMHRRRFDVGQTVEELLLSMRSGLRHGGVELVSDVSGRLVVDGYPGALGQVVTNLVTNALVHAFGPDMEATDVVPAGCEVRVIARPDEAGGVLLCVRDNGCGMTAEVQARIFEPFFTTRLGQGGSGLGMSIVRNIVLGVLGGRIQIVSQPGQGTEVRVRLPAVAPEPETTSTRESEIYAVG